MAKEAPELTDHKAWLGYLQPEGLVVTAQALADAGVQIDKGLLPQLQERFKERVTPIPLEGTEEETTTGIANLSLFLEEFLGWPARFLVGEHRPDPIPDYLTVALPDFDETLSPTIALQRFEPKADASPWVLLIQKVPNGRDLDKSYAPHTRAWDASPTKKFERLLRETKVHVGLLTNGAHFRLVYAPARENSGHVTFPVQAMTEVGGRLILGAFHTLLRSQTVLNAPDRQHLHRLLAISRDYQANVSTQLAEQVLFALYELLRGFQSAHDVKGRILDHPLKNNPNQIYEGLLTVLLRLVFLLFAEDRGLMPEGRTYSRHYSIHGLFEKLRTDHEKFADQMDGRYGAWPRLLALFRIVYGGCRHDELTMPPRHGHLFDPDRFPFLEGRAPTDNHSPDNLPMVSDGTLCRVLQNLMILDGERISYRTLDVEEIGSVYQTIMGFGILVSPGTAVALRGKRKNGGVPAAPIIVIEELLAQPAKDRSKWLKEMADHAFSGDAEKKLKTASTVDDALAVLGHKIDRNATPSAIPKGKLALQPTDERRRSGSHYTPRSFTEPIVRRTLEPILMRFGEHPTQAQILDLKICDIAVGSAAFLVETCRQLVDVLVAAWRHHGNRPTIPPDETEDLLAMRMIAQRCLYGVDRNPMAVDLAKLSLWLATLAKDHPFTFLDHAIRCGDSLVGLTRRQIETFTWKTGFTTGQLWEQEVRKRTAAALRERQNLLGMGDDYTSPQLKRDKLEKADELLDLVRFIGDAAVAAFFAAAKDKARETKRVEMAERIADYLGKGDLKQRPTDEVNFLRAGQFPITPFHWEIEYPEVFDRENPGFDGIVGNPPFAGKTTLSKGNGEHYLDWMMTLHQESHGNADLVAHFFRKSFNLLRKDGCFGLIATNTIRQGDTRYTGLRWICTNGGTIYSARRRFKWPGQAAVVVSVVWTTKGRPLGPFDLDGKLVPVITAYLFHAGGHENPATLQANAGKSFQGSITYGMGFTFSDTDSSGEASPICLMRDLLEKNSQNQDHIFPFLGGDEVNNHPRHEHHRYVIYFGEMDEAEARKWPDLLRILEEKVKPERATKADDVAAWPWWQFWRIRSELYAAIRGLNRVLVINCGACPHMSFAYASSRNVFAHSLDVFTFEGFAALCTIQSRPHELWARRESSSMKDDLRYAPSDCFETFPFPAGFEVDSALEAAGGKYYEFRAALMQDLWQGLTATYNLFHAPDHDALESLRTLYGKRRLNPDWKTKDKVPEDTTPLTLYSTPEKALEAIRELRRLHARMDDVVLRAYGWIDLADSATCDFLLDYEDEDDGNEEEGTRQRKKPWRYRWPDEFRDEVLARLLKLNAERAEEERIAAVKAESTAPPKTRPAKVSGKKRGVVSAQTDLIPPPQQDLFS
jgi:hypothetical protein